MACGRGMAPLIATGALAETSGALFRGIGLGGVAFTAAGSEHTREQQTPKNG